MTEKEKTVPPPGVPLDPFAVDFFGGKNPLIEENEPSSEKESGSAGKRPGTQKKSDWYKHLPRITNAEAEFSNHISNLPENLTETAAKIIAETFARYTFRPAESIGCVPVSVTEINLNEAVSRLSETSQIFLTIGCQPGNSSAIVALNNGFARTLIDSMLGGQGSEFGNPHKLSPIETTIVEFLAANVLSAVNDFLGDALLILQAVKNEPQNSSDPFERGAEIVFNLELGDFKGIVSLIAPPKFLALLEKAQNPLLTRKSGGKKLTDFEKIARLLDLHLQIGTTFLDAASLLFLEPDDIVLIEQPQISLRDENYAGIFQVYAGCGKNFRLRGTVGNTESGGNLQFRIEEILSEEARRNFTPAKFKMDEKENELAEAANPENDSPATENTGEEIFDDQISPSLENIQIALRVEIAGSKISLRELQNLRSGQIIALGCSPTDPVRLVTDNNEEPVATGELVEIEGQLGVRLTKVFI